MKNILLLIFVSVLNIGFSQEVSVLNQTEFYYAFSHTKEMDGLRIERYTLRMLSECESLESIVFQNDTVTLKIKENSDAESIDRTIKYCISKFGFSTYQITE